MSGRISIAAQGFSAAQKRPQQMSLPVRCAAMTDLSLEREKSKRLASTTGDWLILRSPRSKMCLSPYGLRQLRDPAGCYQRGHGQRELGRAADVRVVAGRVGHDGDGNVDAASRAA
jgi:hypothetical protein